MVYDPISARLAENLGYELAMTITPVGAETVLGAPDVGVMTLTEFTEHIRRICRASDISLMISAHHGYGNALNVMRTVEELENAGASGLSLMDEDLPTGFGRIQGEPKLLSLDETIGKLKAALAARQDPSLVIFGGTRASLTAGLGEAIKRVKAYEEIGVDGIHLAQISTREELEAVHAETRLPLFMGHTGGQLLDRQFLAINGVRIASQGNLALLASVKAVYETLKALRMGKSPADLLPALASPELMAQVTRRSQYDEWIKSFLN